LADDPAGPPAARARARRGGTLRAAGRALACRGRRRASAVGRRAGRRARRSRARAGRPALASGRPRARRRLAGAGARGRARRRSRDRAAGRARPGAERRGGTRRCRPRDRPFGDERQDAGAGRRRDAGAVAAGRRLAVAGGDRARLAPVRAVGGAAHRVSRPLDVLDAATLNDHARRLGISVVVALEDDLPRLAALVDNALFRARRVEPPFVMWLGPAAPLPEPSGPGRWRVTLPPSGGEWTSAGMAYYPLWRAAANGRPVATRAGADGQLEVRASGGAIELTYGPGAPELAGVALTVAGILLWLVYPSRAAAPASAHS